MHARYIAHDSMKRKQGGKQCGQSSRRRASPVRRDGYVVGEEVAVWPGLVCCTRELPGWVSTLCQVSILNASASGRRSPSSAIWLNGFLRSVITILPVYRPGRPTAAPPLDRTASGLVRLRPWRASHGRRHTRAGPGGDRRRA